jgi:3-hydroxyacyl-CoA dehydrogenase
MEDRPRAQSPGSDAEAAAAASAAASWHRVAIAGAGLTGASWAGLFAAHGLAVCLWDVDEAALPSALDRAAAAARFLADHELADPDKVEEGVTRLSASADAREAFAGATHIQECVLEDLDVKREVFALIDSLVSAEALICSSSSGLSISRIQTAASRPQRCLAAHPYNPPHLVPLVELAPGTLTAPEALQRARDFYAAVGKEPVVLGRDIPGYIANRISAALWREAVDLVVRGVASADDVDRAICFGPGLRWAVMGPHLLYDLGGGEEGIRGHLRHLGVVKEGMLRDLATWTSFPDGCDQALAGGLEAEKAGRSFDELSAERDELLAAYLAARRRSTL